MGRVNKSKIIEIRTKSYPSCQKVFKKGVNYHFNYFGIHFFIKIRINY